MWMVLTVLTALGAGLLALKLKVPGGMLVGAILGAVFLNLMTGNAFIYPWTRVVSQSLTGAYIGCMMTREDLLCLPRIIRPYLMVLASLLGLNFAVAAVFYYTTDLDLLTCLFCAAPGGVSDTPLVAMDMGANGSVVAVMQFVRMLFGTSCLPSIILFSDRLIEPKKAKETEEIALQSNCEVKSETKPTFLGFLPAMCAALIAAYLGKLSKLPAGALSAALIVTATIKISGHCRGMPMWLRRIAQVISGCCIGSAITWEQIGTMRQLALPVVVLCLGYIVCCVGMGIVIARIFHIPLREAMLTLSPAGATEMAFIAADLGIESTNLVVLQICRLIGCMLLFPQIFGILTFLFRQI